MRLTILGYSLLNHIPIRLSLAVDQALSLQQLDIFNAFLYGDLDEKVLI